MKYNAKLHTALKSLQAELGVSVNDLYLYSMAMVMVDGAQFGEYLADFAEAMRDDPGGFLDDLLAATEIAEEMLK